MSIKGENRDSKGLPAADRLAGSPALLMTSGAMAYLAPMPSILATGTACGKHLTGSRQNCVEAVTAGRDGRL
jgi:hypothetical protein